MGANVVGELNSKSRAAECLRAGLADLYRYYRQAADMLTRVYRDKQALPQ